MAHRSAWDGEQVDDEDEDEERKASMEALMVTALQMEQTLQYIHGENPKSQSQQHPYFCRVKGNGKGVSTMTRDLTVRSSGNPPSTCKNKK